MTAHACSASCTAGWQPSRKCHCRGCGENFSTVSNFDKHLSRGDKLACVPPADAGLVQNAFGLWTQPGEVDVNERFGRKPVPRL